MKISVYLKPNSKSRSIRQEKDKFIIKVTEPAKDNKANLAMIDSLSDYLNIPKSRINLISGSKSKMKTVEIV